MIADKIKLTSTLSTAFFVQLFFIILTWGQFCDATNADAYKESSARPPQSVVTINAHAAEEFSLPASRQEPQLSYLSPTHDVDSGQTMQHPPIALGDQLGNQAQKKLDDTLKILKTPKRKPPKESFLQTLAPPLMLLTTLYLNAFLYQVGVPFFEKQLGISQNLSKNIVGALFQLYFSSYIFKLCRDRSLDQTEKGILFDKNSPLQSLQDSSRYAARTLYRFDWPRAMALFARDFTVQQKLVPAAMGRLYGPIKSLLRLARRPKSFGFWDYTVGTAYVLFLKIPLSAVIATFLNNSLTAGFQAITQHVMPRKKQQEMTPDASQESAVNTDS